MPPRISAHEARQHVESGQALLICAYEDEQKCRDAGITESLPLKQFQARLAGIPKTQELIFVCG